MGEWFDSIEQTREASMLYEAKTGYDSIPTIERVYERTDRGSYLCPFPGCDRTSSTSSGMWQHVHRSEKHGRKLTDEVVAELKAGLAGLHA